MRKYLSIIVLVITSFTVFSQDTINNAYPGSNGKVVYSGVIQVDSTSMDKLYLRAKQFYVENFPQKNSIEFDDRKTGELIGKGSFEGAFKLRSGASGICNIHHTLKISLKEGKFRYEISDITIHYFSQEYRDVAIESYCRNEDDFCIENKKLINQDILSFIKGLETHMKRPTSSEEDW